MAEMTMNLRATTRDDMTAIDGLLGRSYPRVLRADYPASVLVTVLPRMVRAQPDLLASGTYFAIFDGVQALAAGGWTAGDPRKGPRRRGVGHIRHVATDPDRLRQGLGRHLMAHIKHSAAGHGVRQLECLSTRSAVPFYEACGFTQTGPEVELLFGPGLYFPVRPMQCDLGAG